MKAKQKEKLLESVEVLSEAHKSYFGYLTDNQYELATNILIDCQQVAINMGGYIENLIGEGNKAVGYLEEYCEGLYVISQQMMNMDIIKQIDLLNASVIKIEKGIKDDIPNSKPEMIFLPYKASMWDSMESIWMAAKEHGEYDCRVIPIPYFDKNMDGSLGDIHYEGDRFPEYVSVEPWENYNVEVSNPEVVIIHNPYDNTNRATSVHPRFYSKIMKEHIGKLIYCPYFLSKETVQEHFCVNPGTMYADYVFVQSEHIRKQYIKYYKAFEKAYNIEGRLGSAEEKFIALGSPKIDKVRFFDKNKCVLPKEWKEIIGDKKIVLYNTHLLDMPRYVEAFFEKLKWVFNYFENSDKYVLWWRPHPLSEQAVKSMAKEYIERYKSLVEEYKRKKIGIYDDTEDLHRAIGIADIYYGSVSSLVPMFGVTDKPVILQNILCIGKNQEIIENELLFKTECHNRTYGVVKHTNMLISKKKDETEWSIECELPPEFAVMNSETGEVYVDGENIYFCSMIMGVVMIYNVTSKVFKKVQFEVYEKDMDNIFWKDTPIIGKFCINDDYIVAVPHRRSVIVVYSIKEERINYYTKWYEQIEDKLISNGNAYICIRMYSACIVGEYLYLVVAGNIEDVVCCISLTNMELINIYSPMNGGNLFYMEAITEGMWLQWFSGTKSSLILWNVERGILKNHDISEHIKRSDKRARLFVERDMIHVCPLGGDVDFYVSINDGEIKRICENNVNIKCEDNYDYVLTGMNKSELNDKIKKNYLSLIDSFGKDFYEERTFLLPDILEIIEMYSEENQSDYKNKYQKLFYMSDGTAGSMIYKKIVGLI